MQALPVSEEFRTLLRQSAEEEAIGLPGAGLERCDRLLQEDPCACLVCESYGYEEWSFISLSSPPRYEILAKLGELLMEGGSDLEKVKNVSVFLVSGVV